MQDEKSLLKKVVDLLEENGFLVCRVEENYDGQCPYPSGFMSLLVKPKKQRDKLFTPSKSHEYKSPVQKALSLLEENSFHVVFAANTFLAGSESFAPGSNGYISLRFKHQKKQ